MKGSLVTYGEIIQKKLLSYRFLRIQMMQTLIPGQATLISRIGPLIIMPTGTWRLTRLIYGVVVLIHHSLVPFLILVAGEYQLTSSSLLNARS